MLYIDIVMDKIYSLRKNKQIVGNISGTCKSGVLKKDDSINEKCSKKTLKRIAVHEAGHYVVASHFNYEATLPSTIDVPSNSVIAVNIKMPRILSLSETEQFIMIYYAGLVAERHLLDEVSTGFIGLEGSDIKLANDLLEKYAILSDETETYTGFEFESIRSIQIKKSRELLKKTEEIVSENEKKILQITELLLK